MNLTTPSRLKTVSKAPGVQAFPYEISACELKYYRYPTIDALSSKDYLRRLQPYFYTEQKIFVELPQYCFVRVEIGRCIYSFLYEVNRKSFQVYLLSICFLNNYTNYLGPKFAYFLETTGHWNFIESLLRLHWVFFWQPTTHKKNSINPILKCCLTYRLPPHAIV